MSKGFGTLATITIVVGLAIGVGIGMWQAGALPGAKQPLQTQAAAAAIQGQPATSPNNQAGNAADSAGNAARGFPGVVGTVESLSGDTLTVRTANGSTKVTLNADTAIRKTTGVTAAQIAAGEAATVIGTKDAGGVVAARSVQVGETGALVQMAQPQTAPAGSSRQANGPTGQQSQGNLAGLAPVAGTVESASADKIVLKTSSGSVTVSLSDQTTLRKTAAGARSDLVQGVNVTATGTQGADGSLLASSIQIMPDGGAMGGQGGRGRPGQ